MEKKIQLQLVLEAVQRKGEISRNEGVSMFIPRLPNRIADLEKLGFRFVRRREKDDYVYRLVEWPAAKGIVRTVARKQGAHT